MAGQAGNPVRNCIGASANRGLNAFLAATCIIAIIWVVAASTWLVADTVVPWDSKNQFYAFFRFLAASLHAGASPFWNPHHYGGHPSIADPQSLIFAPPFALWALFDPAPSIRAFDTLVYAHLLVGGIAMAGIGSRERWPIAATVLAAAVFMFAGAAAGRLQHTGIILSYGLFPLAWLLLRLTLEKRSLVLTLCFATTAATLALGRNQVALLFCYILAASALAEIICTEKPLLYLRQRLPVLLTMTLVAAALLTAPILLTLQFAELSNRPNEAFDEALKGSIHPANLGTIAVANLFGTHNAYWGPNGASLPEVANTDDSFNYLFVGWLPLILLLWQGLAAGDAFRRGRRYLVVVFVAACLFMLGRYTPAFAVAFEFLPGIDLFRRPADASFVLMASLALLCGYLLADYMHRGGPPLRGITIAIVAIPVIAILASAVWFSARSGHAAAAMAEIAKVAIIPILMVAALAGARTPRSRTIVAAGLTTIAVGELLWWNTTFRLNSAPRADYAVLEHAIGADADAIAILDREFARDRAHGERPRVEIVGAGGAWQNLAMVRGWSATNGYNPLRIGAYDRLVAPGEESWRADARTFPSSFRSYDCALARAIGLKYLVLGRPIETSPDLHGAAIAETLLQGPKVWIYRLRNPMPRLKFTNHIQIADSQAAIRQTFGDFAPDRVVLESTAIRLRSLGPRLAREQAGRARIVDFRPGRIEIDASSDAGGVLSMHATAYPGWIAEIDGKQVPVLRADHLFRAVEVPPGAHRIVFRFNPLSLRNLTEAAVTLFR